MLKSIIIDLLSTTNLTDSEIAQKIILEHPTATSAKEDSLRRYVSMIRRDLELPTPKEQRFENIKKGTATIPQTPDPIDLIKHKIKRAKNKSINFIDLCNSFAVPPMTVQTAIDELEAEKYNVVVANNEIGINNEIPQGGKTTIDMSRMDMVQHRIGIVSDTHLASKYARLDLLNMMYDYFDEQGITAVYHGGNLIDGEKKFNRNDLLVHGMTNQVVYAAKNYPQRQGITTYFISADDHEGWYQQNEAIQIGDYMQMEFERQGRQDLIHLSYIEHDIELKRKHGKAIIRIVHPGGGTAYAVSYQPQKIVESYTGGEKPHILIIGHFHKAMYMYNRNVHIIQAGTFEDQTPFMRKKKIEAHLGGWIIEFNQSKDGAIHNFKSEFVNAFDKGYYKKWNYIK